MKTESLIWSAVAALATLGICVPSSTRAYIPESQIYRCVTVTRSGEEERHCNWDTQPEPYCVKREFVDLAGNSINGPEECGFAMSVSSCVPAFPVAGIEIQYTGNCEGDVCAGNWGELSRDTGSIDRANGNECNSP
jgi:hypothetical protein